MYEGKECTGKGSGCPKREVVTEKKDELCPTCYNEVNHTAPWTDVSVREKVGDPQYYPEQERPHWKGWEGDASKEKSEPDTRDGDEAASLREGESSAEEQQDDGSAEASAEPTGEDGQGSLPSEEKGEVAQK